MTCGFHLLRSEYTASSDSPTCSVSGPPLSRFASIFVASVEKGGECPASMVNSVTPTDQQSEAFPQYVEPSSTFATTCTGVWVKDGRMRLSTMIAASLLGKVLKLWYFVANLVTNKARIYRGHSEYTHAQYHLHTFGFDVFIAFLVEQ